MENPDKNDPTVKILQKELLKRFINGLKVLVLQPTKIRLSSPLHNV